MNVESLTWRYLWELHPVAPFNFDASLYKPDHFPSADNEWRPGVRWQTMRWQGQCLGLKFEDRGTVEEPAIALTIFAAHPLTPEFLAALVAEITYRYSFNLDLADFYRRCGADPQLGPVLQRWRGMRPLNCHSLYEYLVIAIVLQNATIRRSVSMLQSLLAAYGTPVAYDGQELYAFWEPATLAAVPEAALRALKVGYRAKALLRVSAALARQEPDELALRVCSREEQRQALLRLYGVGPASVGYILSDVFHQLDEMEHISPWEQKIYSRLFLGLEPETPAPVATLQALFNARFAGYRMLAVHYIWEDLFWQRQYAPVDWLEPLIRR